MPVLETLIKTYQFGYVYQKFVCSKSDFHKVCYDVFKGEALGLLMASQKSPPQRWSKPEEGEEDEVRGYDKNI